MTSDKKEKTNREELLSAYKAHTYIQDHIIKKQEKEIKAWMVLTLFIYLLAILIAGICAFDEQNRDDICYSLTEGKYFDYMQTRTDFGCRDMKGGEVQIVFGKEEIRVVRIT